jgi:hypothetical protein
MSTEGAFSCFGSSDDDSSDSRTSHSHNRNDETRDELQGSNLRERNNHRRLVAEKMRHGLPMRNPDFEVFQTTNNRGFGLRALRQYSVGDEIMREHAVMRVPNQQAAGSREEAQEKHGLAVHRAFALLSLETQAAVMTLSNNCNLGATALEMQVGVYQTNSFLLGSGDSCQYDQDYGGLFLTVARINHSCRPNAQHFWRHDLQKTLISAVQDIEIGDEILTCYGPSDCQKTADRRLYLEERMLFSCHCKMCIEGNDLGGDDRMDELNRLQEDMRDKLALLGNVDGNMEKEASAVIDLVDRCIALLRLQGLEAASGAMKSVLRCGYQASSARNTLNDEELARSYLERLLLVVGAGEGRGSPNYLEIEQMIRH